jgi:hypothetical protein
MSRIVIIILIYHRHKPTDREDVSEHDVTVTYSECEPTQVKQMSDQLFLASLAQKEMAYIVWRAIREMGGERRGRSVCLILP